MTSIAAAPAPPVAAATAAATAPALTTVTFTPRPGSGLPVVAALSYAVVPATGDRVPAASRDAAIAAARELAAQRTVTDAAGSSRNQAQGVLQASDGAWYVTPLAGVRDEHQSVLAVDGTTSKAGMSFGVADVFDVSFAGTPHPELRAIVGSSTVHEFGAGVTRTSP